MTGDYELTLLKTSYSENEIGDSVPEEVRITILCDVISVTRGEHYAAARNGRKPEITFLVNQYEYDGQTFAEFEGKRYEVIRDFRKKESSDIADFETVELICEGVVNNASS